MDDDQQFCLRWNNHQSTLVSVFDNLLENETLVDCTLAAEGKILKAHKVVLSACSPYFAKLLQEQFDKHPIFILKDVKYQELRAMMDYMYRGEVNISQDQLSALLKAAESLQIKGLSDNRSGVPKPAEQQQQQQLQQQQQQQQHRGLNMQAVVGKLSAGYTLEHTKRARVGHSAMESQEIGDSREGSSSPSRRRRKIRRRSIENAMTEVHDSNSSQMQANLQTNANLAGVGAITAAAASALAGQMPVSSAGVVAAAAAAVAGTSQQMTTSANKKTDSAKTLSETITNENQAGGSGVVTVGGVVAGAGIEQDIEHVAKDNKTNHKQKSTVAVKDASELVIEPKNEYDEEANEETVEDLTLDDEEMGIDDMDHNAGTSQGGEGSSQGAYAWPPHDRTQEDLMLAAQEGQQRDPQVKHDKSEQTDITPDEFELDDCLLESNDIVITQNKDGFVLHVKKVGGNITTARLPSADEEQATAAAVAAATGSQVQITEIQDLHDVKPTLTTLTNSQTIKLPSTECELINLKKIIPASTTITQQSQHPHVTATIINTQQLQQHHQQQQHQQLQHHHHHQQQQDIHQAQHQHQHQQQQQVQSIISTHATTHQPTTINLVGLRNVQYTDTKPIVSRIKYSRGKIITTQGTTAIVEQPQEVEHEQHELTEGTKYEISEIDLNNPTASAAIISDLVKYAEIDDIELPDGTKIGIGFAPTDITEHMQGTTTQLTTVEQHQQQQHHHQQQQQTTHHHLQIQPQQQHSTHHIQTSTLQQHHQQQQHQLQLQDQDDATTSVEATIIATDVITINTDQPNSKSYALLTTRPIKQDPGSSIDGTTTYELSMSDSSMGAHGDDADSKYMCRHCGKKYRWKSTLRRHENVECGGKEPCHPCPYCSYKAKQRGNLGVHVRKHHPEKPTLESKRGRKI